MINCKGRSQIPCTNKTMYASLHAGPPDNQAGIHILKYYEVFNGYTLLQFNTPFYLQAPMATVCARDDDALYPVEILSEATVL